MSRVMIAKRTRFKLRHPNFEKELKSAQTVMCFVLHPEGEPVYKNAESLWNRVNNQYQKLGFVHDSLMTKWILFHERYYDHLKKHHDDWYSERTEHTRDYSSVSKRTRSELDKWFYENFEEEEK